MVLGVPDLHNDIYSEVWYGLDGREGHGGLIQQTVGRQVIKERWRGLLAALSLSAVLALANEM